MKDDTRVPTVAETDTLSSSSDSDSQRQAPADPFAATLWTSIEVGLEGH